MRKRTPEKIGKRLEELARKRRGAAYCWLVEHRQQVAKLLAKPGRPPWTIVAQVAAEDGETISADMLGKAWALIERETTDTKPKPVMAKPPAAVTTPERPPVLLSTIQPREPTNVRDDRTRGFSYDQRPAADKEEWGPAKK